MTIQVFLVWILGQGFCFDWNIFCSLFTIYFSLLLVSLLYAVRVNVYVRKYKMPRSIVAYLLDGEKQQFYHARLVLHFNCIPFYNTTIDLYFRF